MNRENSVLLCINFPNMAAKVEMWTEQVEDVEMCTIEPQKFKLQYCQLASKVRCKLSKDMFSISADFRIQEWKWKQAGAELCQAQEKQGLAKASNKLRWSSI